MGFFKRVKKKINGKWYPQSITVGKPVDTDEVARRVAAESTVSPADTKHSANPVGIFCRGVR